MSELAELHVALKIAEKEYEEAIKFKEPHAPVWFARVLTLKNAISLVKRLTQPPTPLTFDKNAGGK